MENLAQSLSPQALGIGTWLIPIAVFGLIAAFVWLAFEFFSGEKTRAEERLEDYRDPTNRKKETGKVSLAKMLQAATPVLAAPMESKNEVDNNRLKMDLSYAGFRHEMAPMVFRSLQVVGLLVGLFIGGGITIYTMGMTQAAMLRAIMATGFFFYLPTMVLMYLGKQRKEAVFLGLPDALDLMVVCVEAGLGLDQAMRKVAEEMKKSYRVISEEFGLCNLQLQVGRTRTQVLQELGARSGVDDLKSLASILIQADKFGSSIAQALRVQSDSMRTRRRQIAEEKAAKTAVQLIFPLVLFIFPGIFVVLVGPAAITMVNEMFPLMGG